MYYTINNIPSFWICVFSEIKLVFGEKRDSNEFL